MPDRLKYIQIIFEDDGVNPPTIKREYKSVHFAGEGAPRDVDITAEERLAFYAVAAAQNSGLIAEANAARDQAIGERDAALNEANGEREQREQAVAALAAEIAKRTEQ
jgi:hypothetical protein